MSFQGIKPLKDAEGREIPLKTLKLYIMELSREVDVRYFYYRPDLDEWLVKWTTGCFIGETMAKYTLLSHPGDGKRIVFDRRCTYTETMETFFKA